MKRPSFREQQQDRVRAELEWVIDSLGNQRLREENLIAVDRINDRIIFYQERYKKIYNSYYYRYL